MMIVLRRASAGVLLALAVALVGCAEPDTSARCGDNEVNLTNEDCDGNDLDDMGCEDLDFTGGTLACTDDCEFDTSDCEGCEPDCDGRDCGDDGCGGSCGECGLGETCSADGLCEGECTPDCDGRDCGDDGCSGSCGSCDAGETCSAAGVCEGECTPDCTGLDCGDDGCGGSCGDCDAGETCEEGLCVGECTPDCTDLECGDDGCGGSCGDCADDETCEEGTCVGDCVPDCTDLECGDDGCGGSCGDCAVGESCVDGACTTGCLPDCTGRDCGGDGCGGSCGTCAVGETCSAAGVCEGACTPDCVGLDCGDDGCGGSCGSCAVGESCIDGSCTESTLCSALDDPCDPADDQPVGFICVNTPSGNACREFCDPDLGGCTAPELCWSDDGINGYCRGDECESFWSNDCGAGWDCIPASDTMDLCIPNGSTTEGIACAEHADCVAGAVCTGVCTAPNCAPLTSTVECTGSEICSGFAIGGTVEIDLGVCVDGCTPFTGTECDAAGEWCLPDYYTAGEGVCVEPGTASEGESCGDGVSCNAGLTCVSVDVETALCYPICDPVAAAGTSGSCDADEECASLYSDGTLLAFGFCDETTVTGCTPFISGDCAVGEWCMPSLETPDTGDCIPGGTAGVGEACDTADCGADLVCLTDGFCHSICDHYATTGEPGACAAGDVCGPLGDGAGGSLWFGVCTEGCTPFTGTECDAAGEWCIPDFELEGIGLCIEPGTVGDGESCATASCDAGLICLSDELCYPICDLDASAGEPGACSAMETCATLGDGSGGTLPFGVCD